MTPFPFTQKDFFAQSQAWRQELVFFLQKTLMQQRNACEEARLVDAMDYAVMGGGKRVRGLLAISTGLMLGADKKAALTIAAALEFMHAYSLIHDDLPSMDDADLRRGKASLHKAYDEATAILAGDALQSLSFEVLASCASAHCGIMVQYFAQAAGGKGMCGGQMLDLMASEQRSDFTATKQMQAKKTGALIEASLLLPALFCGLDQKGKHSLKTYGAALGLLFQITDDILDATTSAEILGKPVGSDIKAGKATFITHLGLEGAKAEAVRLETEAIMALKTLDKVNSYELAYLLHMACHIRMREH